MFLWKYIKYNNIHAESDSRTMYVMSLFGCIYVSPIGHLIVAHFLLHVLYEYVGTRNSKGVYFFVVCIISVKLNNSVV